MKNADSKQLWNFINNKFELKKSSIEVLHVNNTKITNDYRKANYFNNFFSKVGSNVANNLIKPIINKTLIFKAPTVSHSLFLNPTDMTEVFNKLNKFKNKNGRVYDIHAKTLKNI